ncbi:type 1 fimbrial protein [Erwinia sp. AnSW2-5]|uniref:type 1 fimbrial protein n=1 Tax=Erwinia sp. AnSW2-5 TaxID=3367692 RepID=UPI00385BFDF4
MNSIVAATAVILFASWTSNVLAEQKHSERSSGIIHFSGGIVESECTHDIQQQKVVISCERNGQEKSRTLSLNNTDLQSLPHNVGTSQISWLDRQKRLGILTVDYR